MSKMFNGIIIVLLTVVLVPLVLADGTINFVSPTDNSTFLNRNFIEINVTSSSENLTNITIELYNSTGVLVNSTYTNESNLFANFTDLTDDVYYFNATGNYTDVLNVTETINTTIDTINPTIIFESNTDNTTLTNKNYIIINVTANDTHYNYTTVDVYNSTGSLVNITITTQTNTFINYTVPADGTYYFNATVYDTLGQSNSTTTRNITIDTITPSINYVYPTDTIVVGRNYIQVNVSVNKSNIVNLTIDVYNATGNLINSTTVAANNSFVNISNLADGMYYYNATARDSAGNTGFGVTQNVTINTVSPIIYFVAPTDTGYISRDYLSVNVTATSSNITEIQINVYNSTGSLINTSNTSQANLLYTVYNLSDGTYYYNATAFDVLNHTNSTQGNVTIDTQMPSISFNNGTETSGAIQNRNNIIINFTATDTHYNTTIIRLYNSSGGLIDISNATVVNDSNTRFINYTAQADGTYYFNATAYDLAGNANHTETRNVTIDTKPPSIIFNSPTINQSITPFSNIFFNISANDANLANITLYLYNSIGQLINATTQSSSIEITIGNLNDGKYYYNATAYDTLNHVNISTTRNITVDTSAPTVNIHSPIDSVYNTNDILINITIVSLKNMSSCYYNIDGQNYSIPDCDNITANITDGAKFMKIYANDSTGAIGYSSVRFMVDSTNSTTSANSPNLSINDNNNTNIFVPSNTTITQVIIQQNVTDNITIKIYFANVSSTENQSTVFINNSINITRNTTLTTYALLLPDNLTITGISNWTGEIMLPTVRPGSVVTVTPTSGMSVTVSEIIGLGYTERLNLSSAARIIFRGEGGKIVGFNDGSGAITRITYTCPSPDNQSLIDESLNGTYFECAITSGGDLIVWTKHFSNYVTFTEATIPVTPGGGGGGSSGGGGGGTGGYDVNISTEAPIQDYAVFNQYWLNMVKGLRTLTVDETGMPITHLYLDINRDVETAADMKITSQSKNPVNTSTNSDIYRYLIFNTSIPKEYFNDINIKFKIAKSWISQKNLTSANITVYSYMENGMNWTELNVSKETEDTGYTYYSVHNTNLKTLAIGGPLTEKTLPVNVTNLITIVTVPAYEQKVSTNTVVVKPFTENVGDFFVNFKDNAYNWFMGLNKENKSLIVIAISSIIILILGVITGVLVYRNTIKPRRLRRMFTGKKLPATLFPYAEEPRTISPPVPSAPPTQKVETYEPPASTPEAYTKKITELILQCEYALDNGKVEEAKKMYAEARGIYFNSGLDYEQKSKVYNKIIEMYGRLNK